MYPIFSDSNENLFIYIWKIFVYQNILLIFLVHQIMLAIYVFKYFSIQFYNFILYPTPISPLQIGSNQLMEAKRFFLSAFLELMKPVPDMEVVISAKTGLLKSNFSMVFITLTFDVVTLVIVSWSIAALFTNIWVLVLYRLFESSSHWIYFYANIWSPYSHQ